VLEARKRLIPGTTPKYLRLPYPIFNVNDLMLPVASGKQSAIQPSLKLNSLKGNVC
jgi:hypothetical protein